MILNLDKALEKRANRNEPKFFWAIDLHRTIIYPTYDNSAGFVFYPYARQTLEYISNLENHVLILYTSTHDNEVKRILHFLESNGINFKYVNENPECPSTALCNFERKFYFDVLIDDKAGFDPEKDWNELYMALGWLDQEDKLV